MSSSAHLQPDIAAALQQVVVPDLWQQQAIAALREGQDVVVHAPTGAGKTLIFELWSRQGKNRGQAIYTVPTRALANDKLAEWRARGWDVGIATGDLSDNIGAPVLVATLETQKQRLLRGEGPALLVVDEYQMLGDQDRGLNYELSIALAPPQTQLLLLSGSVANPQDIVKWLTRLGRRALLVRHDHRPVPLEEVYAQNLNYHVPSDIRTYWARLVAKALAEDLGPILVFAPRRQAAEALASELSRLLPNPVPLDLTPDQKHHAGERLSRLLKTRIAYHHSGLSYAARAGVVEPLAKAGQLRVVVATMGLAAGINFSLRSVALAGESYRRDGLEQPLRPDEILQMFGRAGRRGLDETGFVIVSANNLRLLDARPGHLARSGLVDWNALLGLMAAAADAGRHPFAEAVRVQERLFTSKPIFLGIEESLRHPDTPCQLCTDSERARHVRRLVRQMLNSQGEWETMPAPANKLLRHIFQPVPAPPPAPPLDPAAPQAPLLRPILSIPEALEKIGVGQLCVLEDDPHGKTYGRAISLADVLHNGRLVLAKWIRRLAGWEHRQVPREVWTATLAPLLEKKLAAQNLPVLRFLEHDYKLLAHVSLAEQSVKVPVDRHGLGLWKPPEREVLAADCARCPLVETCRQLPTTTGTALLWRRLGLMDAHGVPTVRGRVASCFAQGDGLALAAALEDASYPLEDLVFDLANLDASFRFAGDESRWAGRLALTCQQAFGVQNIPGYLEAGVPVGYGSGAEQIVASVHRNPQARAAWITDILGVGDIDRIIIEWRSTLRQIVHAPELPWPRWMALKALAKTLLNDTESPTLTELPPLAYHQTRRVDHRLILRR